MSSPGRRIRDALPLLPFLALVTVFLIIPTLTVIVSAFFADGAFSLARIQALFSNTALSALWKSVLLSGSTAIIGAVLGAVLAWLIVGRPATSVLRRAVISLCSVLAQFGGVALAFAFLATIGLNGVLTLWVQQHFGWNLAGSGWLPAPLRTPGRSSIAGMVTTDAAIGVDAVDDVDQSGSQQAVAAE